MQKQWQRRNQNKLGLLDVTLHSLSSVCCAWSVGQGDCVAAENTTQSDRERCQRQKQNNLGVDGKAIYLCAPSMNGYKLDGVVIMFLLA
jgi:hypothetical protein